MKCEYCETPQAGEETFVCNECLLAHSENPDELLIETLQEQLQLVARERDEVRALLTELADRAQTYVTYSHGFIMDAIGVMKSQPDLFPERMWDAIKTKNDMRFNELIWKHQTPKMSDRDKYSDRRGF